jgi:hypothetical protein
MWVECNANGCFTSMMFKKPVVKKGHPIVLVDIVQIVALCRPLFACSSKATATG